MTVPPNDSIVSNEQPVDLETNFARQRRHYEKQLEQERNARLAAEERAAQLQNSMGSRSNPKDEVDDDDDSEPYIDKKRLKRTLDRVIPGVREEAKNDVRQEVQRAIVQERRNAWMKTNSDFQEVMSHAQTFAERFPEEAETILELPEGFERQKLVYHAIKRQQLHKKPEPQQSIQQKIDANRKSPYYQPSGVGSAPYSSGGDYSPSGQKNAYEKMQELKQRLRI